MEEIEGSRSYHHPGTEFLRLHASTAGERLAGNAGRKTEIVFDTRTGSGLPTECARIETMTERPSDAAYTAVERPAGPAPTTATSSSTCHGSAPKTPKRCLGNIGFDRSQTSLRRA
jgi:hypothetical protein